jgi:hypothetical protein
MSKDIKVEVVETKRSIQKRTTLGTLMEPRIATSAICQRQSTVKEACGDLVAAAQALATEDQKVTDLEAKLAAQRTIRDEATVKFDRSFDLVVAGVEKFAITLAEVTELALAIHERQSFTLAPPISIAAMFDGEARSILVEVKLPQGATTCLVEVSTNPGDPGSWKRVRGHGARRTLTGLAAGTYWFRALCSRGNDDSDYIDPTSVVVK